MINRLRYAVCVSRVVFVHGDMLPVRLMLAMASGVMGAFMFVDDTAFERAAYSNMAHLAPQWLWATAFLCHFAAENGRVLFDPDERIGLAIIVNVFGFVLWFASSLAMTLSIGHLSPSLAMDWTMVVASAWALFRTGRNTSIVPE